MDISVRGVRFVGSGRVLLLLTLVLIIGWTTALGASNPSMKAAAALCSHAVTYILFLQSFRWAANPYRPMLRLLRILWGKGEPLAKRKYIDPAVREPENGQLQESANSMCTDVLMVIDLLSSPDGDEERGIVGLVSNSLVPTTIFGFATLYVVLAASFSMALFLVERAWGPQISGLATLPSLHDYFYFSILSQATAVPGNIEPISMFGQFWIVWIVMTGILLLTMLIALFTTSVGIQKEGALRSLKDILEQVRKQLKDWQGLLQQHASAQSPLIDGPEEVASGSTS